MSTDRPTRTEGLFAQKGRKYSDEEQVRTVLFVEASSTELGGLKKGIGALADIDLALRKGPRARFALGEREAAVETGCRRYFEFREAVFGECDLETIARRNFKEFAPQLPEETLGEVSFQELEPVDGKYGSGILTPSRPRGRPRQKKLI